MIFIIERAFDVMNGHEHTQIEAIRALVPEAAIAVVTHRDFEPGVLEGDVRVHPLLSTRKDVSDAPEAAVARDVSVLRKLTGELPDGRTCVFVVPSAYQPEIRTALDVLEAETAPVRFVLRLLRPEALDGLNEAELERLADAVGAGRLSLHTETRELKEHLREAWSLASDDDFLLPCTVDPDLSSGAKRETTGLFRIGYLGNFRTEKGAERIPEILDALGRRLAREPGSTKLEFLLQWPARIQSKSRKLVYVAKVSAIALKHRLGGRLRVRWYKGGISPEAFLELLLSVDAMLVPYEPSAYRYRGSGIIIDAVLARIPIVYDPEIGMSRHTGFGNAVPGSDTQGFADAIVSLATGGVPEAALDAARDDLLAQIGRTQALMKSLLG